MALDSGGSALPGDTSRCWEPLVAVGPGEGGVEAWRAEPRHAAKHPTSAPTARVNRPSCHAATVGKSELHGLAALGCQQPAPGMRRPVGLAGAGGSLGVVRSWPCGTRPHTHMLKFGVLREKFSGGRTTREAAGGCGGRPASLVCTEAPAPGFRPLPDTACLHSPAALTPVRTAQGVHRGHPCS